MEILNSSSWGDTETCQTYYILVALCFSQFRNPTHKIHFHARIIHMAFFFKSILVTSSSTRPSQKGVAQRTPDQRTARSNRIRSTYRLQRRVHFHQVHGDQTSRFVHAFGDVVTLSQGQPASDGGAGAGSPLGI